MSEAPLTDVKWPDAVRIIRSQFPPIDLFEDVADPRDWPLIIAAADKTNPRMALSIGALDSSRQAGGCPARARVI